MQQMRDCFSEIKKRRLVHCFDITTIASINEIHSAVVDLFSIDARHLHHHQATFTNDLHCYDLMCVQCTLYT